MACKVAIVDDRYYPDYEEEKSVLSEAEAEIITVKSQDPSDIIENCGDADAIIVNLAPITGEIISALSKCRVISRYGVGVDTVDMESATKKGIWVANVPDYCDEDVSDQAFALFLSCVRNVALRDRQVRKGIWDIKSTPPQRRITGKTFVFFGYGRIARTMHRKLAGFKPGRVLVCDPYIDEKTIKAAGAQKADWDRALAEGDFFSIHMPLTEETKGIFGEKAFRAMKPDAIVVNTSRGPIIDEKALYRALKEGWIGSAGLDVFEKEPADRDNPLLKLDNITVSGHTGFYTEESKTELKSKAARNVLETLVNGRPLYPVNQIGGADPRT